MARDELIRTISANLIKHMSANGIKQSDLSKALGVSQSTVGKWVLGKALPRMGMIEKIADYFGVEKSALLENRKSRYFKRVPILGTIAAGVPIYAEQNIDDYFGIPEEWDVDFVLRVRGDSMIGAGILDNALAFCRRQNDVDSGQIAVVLVDDEAATLKRIRKYPGVLVLHPENVAYKDMEFVGSGMKDVKILGICVRVLNEVS